jgi:transposase-like protein
MARKKAARKKAARKQTARRKRGSFSREKKLAVVRAHKAGIPASKLGSELGIKPINIYLWTREVKKRGEARAFQRDRGGLTAKQARLLKAAKSAK